MCSGSINISIFVHIFLYQYYYHFGLFNYLLFFLKKEEKKFDLPQLQDFANSLCCLYITRVLFSFNSNVPPPPQAYHLHSFCFSQQLATLTF